MSTAAPHVGVLVEGMDLSLRTTARLIDELGYDSAWAGDHVLSYVDGLTAVMALGAGSDRLVVGTSILLAALRSPALLARSVATISEELGDRFILGVGAGGDLPQEFDLVGVPMAGRGGRTETAAEVIRNAIDHGQLGAHPFTLRPGVHPPPIWFGGRSHRAAERAGRLGDGFIPYLVTPVQAKALYGLATQAADAAGRTSGPDLAVDVMVSVGDNDEDARSAMTAYRAYGLTDDLLLRYTVAGNAASCAEQLCTYVEAGAKHLILHFTAPPDEKIRQVRRLGEVLGTIKGRPRP